MSEGVDDGTVDGLDAAGSRRNVGNTAAAAGIQSAVAGVCHETAKGQRCAAVGRGMGSVSSEESRCSFAGFYFLQR